MSHLDTAYALGASTAEADFEKNAIVGDVVRGVKGVGEMVQHLGPKRTATLFGKGVLDMGARAAAKARPTQFMKGLKDFTGKALAREEMGAGHHLAYTGKKLQHATGLNPSTNERLHELAAKLDVEGKITSGRSSDIFKSLRDERLPLPR